MPRSATPDPRGVLRRRWWILLACLVVLPTAVYAYSSRQAEVYSAELVAEGTGDGPSIRAGDYSIVNPGSPSLAAGYLGTPGTTREIVRQLAGRPLASLTATVEPRTDWLRLAATSTDPDAVDATLQAGLKGLQRTLEEVADRQIVDAIASQEASLQAAVDPLARAEIRGHLRELRALRAQPTDPFRLVQSSPATVIEPNPGRNALLAFVLALLLAPALMLLAERFDRTLRRAEEVEDAVGAPLLASLSAPTASGSRAATLRRRQVERLRDSLIHFELGVPLRSVMVVSPFAGDGRTTTARDLASAFARAGRRVVLVHADLRGSASRGPGLAEVLAGMEPGEALRADDAQGGYHVLPAGVAPTDPAALLAPERVARVLQSLGQDHDLVVVDTPPLLTVSDTLSLLRQVSGVVCLVRLDRTPRRAVTRMTAIIDAAGGRILGSVATGRAPSAEKAAPKGIWGPAPMVES